MLQTSLESNDLIAFVNANAGKSIENVNEICSCCRSHLGLIAVVDTQCLDVRRDGKCANCNYMVAVLLWDFFSMKSRSPETGW